MATKPSTSRGSDLAARKNCAQQPVWYTPPSFALKCFRLPTRPQKSPKKWPCTSRQAHKKSGPAIRTEPWSFTFPPPKKSDKRRKFVRNFRQSLASQASDSQPVDPPESNALLNEAAERFGLTFRP